MQGCRGRVEKRSRTLAPQDALTRKDHKCAIEIGARRQTLETYVNTDFQPMYLE